MKRILLLAFLAVLCLCFGLALSCDDDDDDNDDDSNNNDNDDADDDDTDWEVLFEDDFSNGLIKWHPSGLALISWPSDDDNAALGIQELFEDSDWEMYDGSAHTENSFDLTSYAQARLRFTYAVDAPYGYSINFAYTLGVYFGNDHVHTITGTAEDQGDTVELSLNDFCGWATEYDITFYLEIEIEYGSEYEGEEWTVLIDDVVLEASTEPGDDDDDDTNSDDDDTAPSDHCQEAYDFIYDVCGLVVADEDGNELSKDDAIAECEAGDSFLVCLVGCYETVADCDAFVDCAEDNCL
jgi:hypothetical protein